MKIHPPWRLPRRKIDPRYRVVIEPIDGAYKYSVELYFKDALVVRGRSDTHLGARRWARSEIRRQIKRAEHLQRPKVEYRL